MIDYPKAKERFTMLNDADFLKVIEESEKQFPVKVNQLLQHVENQNHRETGYYALHIRESYAFVFYDKELNNLCHQLEDAANQQNFQEVNHLALTLKNYSEKFLQQLAEIKKQLHV